MAVAERADISEGTLSRRSSHCSPFKWCRSSEPMGPVTRVQIVPIRSGCEYGRHFSRSALTTEKIAVFAPMESASVRITVPVKAGVRHNCRTANLRFCPSIPIEDHPHSHDPYLETLTGECVLQRQSSLPSLHPGCLSPALNKRNKSWL